LSKKGGGEGEHLERTKKTTHCLEEEKTLSSEKEKTREGRQKKSEENENREEETKNTTKSFN